MLKKHKGARSELLACVWLLDRGYDVFRNVSAHGLVDLVAIKGEEVLRLDVKSSYEECDFLHALTEEQYKAGVLHLFVNNDGTCKVGRPIKPISMLENIPCRGCGNMFKPNRRNTVYCSNLCYSRAYAKTHQKKPYRKINRVRSTSTDAP